ncbi:MAG: DUF4145 domain-containing protein [Cryomorphaceae bacterium]|nr:MAG: DUF4145 domain-containing protein [Cryomorphaceae bacterium]
MSNFQFLQKSWPEIYREATEAEQLALISPKACAIICRSALEKTVQWLYANDPDLEEPYDTKLGALMNEQCFKDILKPSMYREINLIRLFGNNAAHGKPIKPAEGMVALKNLYRFTSFLAIYYAETEPDLKPFNEALIPTGQKQELQTRELQRMEQNLRARNEAIRADREALEKQALEVEGMRRELEAEKAAFKERREAREATHDLEKEIPLLVSEQQTRKLYIDQSLKEVGWGQLREGYELEYEVKGMPASTNRTGIGYVDYVLWGDNGKPLAVIEAKRTMADPRKGRHQAKLYADCLEASHGQRPIIFYTNGFETYLWDDRFYPERQVSGFFTKDELQRAIDRREDRLDLRQFTVNEEISGRYYQQEAVQRVAESFVRENPSGELTGAARKALLVMATGSGKTRTAISIVDMLTKCRWAKRILFLADRNALVSQAKKRFGEFLPNLSSIDLTKEKEDDSTRLVFSTYPTMMNRIDGMRNHDERFYSPGHFDVIIIDEAHRSVYQKYGAIFYYFDALLVGLTATPKTDIDRNTYGLFDIEDNNPTFAYELDQAVNDQYLVPPKGIDVPLKFPREGIRYSDLSEREKGEYEEKYGDPTSGEVPDFIGGDALNNWLFNNDTVDKALQYLMEKGLKVEGGDKLGKTIIFARSHKHAVFIEERFNKNFPEYRGDFLRVIDNYESKAPDLLERFCDEYEDKDPQIAVSVDMMDTGVDAPRVVNLVFFKMVRSATKFWQMIGRGTRLAPDLFGPGKHKEYFIIFDLCGNLEFFEENPEGAPGSSMVSLTQRIFELKLEIMMAIRRAEEKSEPENELAAIYEDWLYQCVKKLDRNRFVVQAKLRYVVEYCNKTRWQNLSMGDVIDIKEHLSHLPSPEKGDHELARRFDVLMLTLNLVMLRNNDASRYINQLQLIVRALGRKMNIPAVSAQRELINSIQAENFWQNVHVKKLEDVRVALRELIKFLDVEKQKNVYTNLEDAILENEVRERPVLPTIKNSRPYRERVEAYIRKNRHHLTISKIRSNTPITVAELQELERLLFDGEERGTREDYVKEYGDQPLGVFIRSIVGLDIQAAKAAFADFLLKGNLTADQMTFINNIISFLEQNGIIEARMLFEEPFTHVNDQGLLGVFDEADAHKVISILDGIKENAGVG